MNDNFHPFSLCVRGKIHEFSRPAIMGIINVTPDSFYDASRTATECEIIERTSRHLSEGCDIIDIGAYSSRPGASDVCPEEELHRLQLGLKAIRQVAPDIPVSVDTFRAKVAETAIKELGADIINDIGGGALDVSMFETVASLNVPYILMHMRGTPATMQSHTDYSDVTVEVIADLSHKLALLEELGVNDVIVDPGLGFGKTTEQNYQLLRDIPAFISALGRPVLIGLSRKSMLTRPLYITPDKALCATTAANTIALLSGASVLRVHDVKAAVEARTITSLVQQNAVSFSTPSN